jgi:uncharacterized protein YkwD
MLKKKSPFLAVFSLFLICLGFNFCAPSALAGTARSLTVDEMSIFLQINTLRNSLGIPPLVLENSLELAAISHSEAMNSADSLAHAGSDSYSTGFETSGENIACGNSSADATFQQWFHSQGHYANMTNPQFRYIGIARAGTQADADSKNCSFYWTTDFGG